MTDASNPTVDALRIAELRMFEAKALFSKAALHCLRGSYDTPQRVKEALLELEGARQCVRRAVRELEDAQATSAST